MIGEEFRTDIANVFDATVNNTVVNLAKFGAVGTVDDIYKWLKMYHEMGKQLGMDLPDYVSKFDEDATLAAVEALVGESQLMDSGKGYKEYKIAAEVTFPSDIHFLVLGDLAYAPLQLIRSRLESYLIAAGVSLDDLTDISIGVIEAGENAVKYGSGGIVSVHYGIDSGNTFHVSMKNPIKYEPVEEKIKDGKFSEGFTLMRGIMAINKLFDSFDLNRDDDKLEVIFTASKKVSRN